MEKIWLFIWRFQPIHYGHLDAINQAISWWITKILIWIWSADKWNTEQNPFTSDERRQMIYSLLSSKIDINIDDIYLLNDFWDNKLWRKSILKNLPKFDYIITWNDIVKDIFLSIWIPSINLKTNIPISASNIRKQIVMWKKQKLTESIPQFIIDYLDSIWAFQRLKKIYSNEFIQPSLAVDGIIFDEEWKLILIERKNEPYGFALPGWFIDYGEAPEDALRREMKEELWVEVEIKKLVNVYGDPDRDPRKHVISIAYLAQIISWTLCAWDDAKSYIKVLPNQLNDVKLAFDHMKIIKEALKN